MSEKIKKAKEQMLKEYLSSQLIYVEYTSYIENKVKNILIENGIKYQSLSSRVKSYDSLENKLTEKIINGVCKDIKKMNDLSGVRVIFYDEEELKKFNSIVYDEFNVKSYRPSEDIMEYDGINITVSLKKDFNKFKGLLCEIQLTTLLSHAMNEFGHNIIYKDIDELQLAYSTTIHKSQGSEYPVTFVVVSGDTSTFLLIRKILYTALSRGKEKVYLFGLRGDVQKCIDNNYYEERYTKLCKFLKEEPQPLPFV